MIFIQSGLKEIARIYSKKSSEIIFVKKIWLYLINNFCYFTFCVLNASLSSLLNIVSKLGDLTVISPPPSSNLEVFSFVGLQK